MGLTHKVINALYLEAMLLADEARAYFDQFSRDARDGMTPLQRVTFSCESLKVTTRLMHIVAWLLGHRSVIEAGVGAVPTLGSATASDPAVFKGLPNEALNIIKTSEELYNRIARLEGQMERQMDAESPVRSMQSRLERAF
jgi:regulator of CtrA degradation